MKTLEQSLNVRLLNRSARGNSLTDAGEILFGDLYRAFETMEHSIEKITGSSGREILNVSVAPFFSAHWLTPRLHSFMTENPDIDLRLHHAYHPADPRREGIDLGINWGAGAWPGVEKEKVLDGALTPVMSPAFFKAMGKGGGPDWLLHSPLLYEFDLNHWRLWFDQFGLSMPADARSLRLSDSHALRRMALDGHGAALFFSSLIADDLNCGRLVQPFPASIHVGYDYYLNYSSAVDLPRKAKVFRRFVARECTT